MPVVYDPDFLEYCMTLTDLDEVYQKEYDRCGGDVDSGEAHCFNAVILAARIRGIFLP